MAPRRHVLVMIPPGSGFTQANLNRLSTLSAIMKDLQSMGLNITESRKEVKTILNRITRNGGYNSPANLQKILMPYLVKYRRLRAALNNKLEGVSNFNNGKWRKVQEAGGKFLALRNVAALRRPPIPSPGSRRAGSNSEINLIATLMRPHMLAASTPLSVTFNRFIRGPPKPRKRKSPSPARSPPKSVTTRSGRR